MYGLFPPSGSCREARQVSPEVPWLVSPRNARQNKLRGGKRRTTRVTTWRRDAHNETGVSELLLKVWYWRFLYSRKRPWTINGSTIFLLLHTNARAPYALNIPKTPTSQPHALDLPKPHKQNPEPKSTQFPMSCSKSKTEPLGAMGTLWCLGIRRHRTLRLLEALGIECVSKPRLFFPLCPGSHWQRSYHLGVSASHNVRDLGFLKLPRGCRGRRLGFKHWGVDFKILGALPLAFRAWPEHVCWIFFQSLRLWGCANNPSHIQTLNRATPGRYAAAQE